MKESQSFPVEHRFLVRRFDVEDLFTAVRFPPIVAKIVKRNVAVLLEKLKFQVSQIKLQIWSNFETILTMSRGKKSES